MKTYTTFLIAATTWFTSHLLTAQITYEWSDDGGNNSWNNSSNWRNSSGNIPDGTNYGAWFNYERNAGKKVYVTSEDGNTGTTRDLHTYKVTGNSSGDNWRIYAKSGETSNSGVTVKVHNTLDTALANSSSLNIYHTLQIDGSDVTWNSSGSNIILNQPLAGSGTLDGDNTSGGGMTLTKNGSFSGTIHTGQNNLDIDHTDALDSAIINLEDSSTARLDFTDVSTIDIGAITGSGKLTVGNGKTLQVGDNSARTYSGVITGNGSITKTGSGVWTLSGASTFNGDITVASSVGNIKLGAFDTIDNAELILNKNNGLTLNGLDPKLGGLSGSGNLNLGSNTLTINGSASGDYTGVLSGTGGLTVQSGTFYLNSASTYTGPTAINGGRLEVKTSTQLPSLQDGIDMSGSGGLYLIGTTQTVGQINSSSTNSLFYLKEDSVLKVGNSNDSTFAGALYSDWTSTSNAVRKIGSGKLTFAKDSNQGSGYHGDIYIDAGTLALGNGTHQANITFYSDNAIDASMFYNSSTLEINAPSDTTYNLQAHISGIGDVIVKNGNIYTRGYNSTTHSNNTFSGGLTLEGGTFFASDISELGTAPINFAGGALGIEGTTITQASDLTMGWTTTGTNDIRMDIDSGGNNFNWDSVMNHSGGFEKLGPGTVRFTSNNTYTGDTTISEGRLVIGYGSAAGSVAGDIINHAGLVYNRTGSLTQSTNISGDGTIIKYGSGTVTLEDISDGAGDITQSGGGELHISSDLGGTRALAIDSTGTLRVTGNASHTGGTTVSDGLFYIGDGGTTGSLSGDIVNDTGVLFYTSSDKTYPGVISGSGEVYQLGTGTTTFTQNQDYTDQTIIGSGTLQLGDGTTHPTLATSGIVNNSLLKINYDGSRNADFPVSGTGDIEKLASGRLTLREDWTHSGNTTVTQGTLAIGNGNTLGWLDTPITNNGTVEFKRSDNNTFSNVISGTGQVKNGSAGILTLTANNTYTGTTDVDAGEIQLGNGGTTGYVAGNIDINSGKTFRLNRSDDFSLPGAITGNGTLIKENNNTVTLPVGITSTGPLTTLSAGTLIVGNGGTTGQLRGDVANESILILNTSGNNTHEGDHTGTGSLTKQGTGTATFSGALDHTGGTTISAGTLELTGTATSSFQNDATFKYSPAVDTNFTQSITGNGAFIKGGSKTLSFTSNITFTGGVTISGGTLAFGNGGAAGKVNQDITNNATLSFNRSNDFTFAKVISGTGDVQQDGTGTTTLTKDNTYSGDTTVNAGTLKIHYNGTDGTVGGDLVNNSNLQLQSDSGTQLIPGGLTGSGATTKSGAGTTAFTGNINPSGTFTVNEGTLSVGNGGTSGTLAQPITINANLAFNRSDDVTHSKAVNGTGSVTKDGAGTLTLQADWTHTGGTQIDGGTLRIGNRNTTGSIVGDIVTNANLNFYRSDETTHTANISGTGEVTKSRGNLFVTGDWTHTGGTTNSVGTLTIGNGGTTGSIAGAIIANSALKFNRSDNFLHAGAISGTSTLSQEANSTLTLTGSHNYTGNTNLNAGILNFAPLSASSLNSAITGIGSLQKSGAETLTLLKNATHSGGTTISAGTLRLGDGTTNPVHSGSNILNNAALEFNLSNSQTFSRNISGTGTVEKLDEHNFTLTGDWSHTGNTTLSGGNLYIGNNNTTGSITGQIVNDAKLTFNRTGEFTHAGNISGTGQVVKTRNGIASLTGDWTHTGGTTISQGSLVIGNGGTTGDIDGNITNNATLKFNRTDTHTLDSLISGSGKVTQGGSGTTVLTAANTYTGNTTINTGTLELDSDSDYELGSTVTGAGLFKKSGSGTVTLTKTATNTGGTTISGGTLCLGNGSSTPQHNNSNITNNAKFEINHSGSTTWQRDINGTGSIDILDTDTLTLTGDWTHAGGTTVTQGNLRIGNEGTDGWISGDIVTDATLTFFRNDANTYAGNISGSGDVVSTARAGNLTITGDWTHTGSTKINRGSLNIGNGGTEGWIDGDITNGANLYINRSDDVAYSHVLSGAGKLYKQGAGSLELTNASTMSGLTTVEAGTLIVNNTSGVALNGSVTIESGATLSGAGSLGSAVTCAGTVAPGNSPGTLTVAGNFNLTGNYICELSGAANDRIDVGGTLTITNGAIDFDVLNPLTEDYYILATYNSLSGSSFLSVTDLPVGYMLEYGFDDGNSSQNIALVSNSIVPELESIDLHASESSPTNDNTIQFVVNFSRPVTGVEATDFEITYAGGSNNPSISGSGDKYTLTISNITGNGTLTVGLIEAHGIESEHTIPLAATTETGSVEVDNAAPTVTITADTASPTNATALVFSVDFDDVVQNVNSSDFTYSGPAFGDFPPLTQVSNDGNGTNYTVTVFGLTGTGTVTLSFIPFNDIEDTVGNALGASSVSGSLELDNTAPVISLNGDSLITITAGDAWSDPGATATDTTDGSVSVSVSGDTVNTNSVNSYLITYDATDTAGNAAIPVTRIVSVIALPALERWIAGFDLTGDDALLTADPDGDGRTNLEEFAFDGDPTNGSDRNKITYGFEQAEGVNVFSITLPARNGALFIGPSPATATVDGITYTVRGAYELEAFTANVYSDAFPNVEDLATLNEGWSYQRFYLYSPAPQPKGFLKVEINEDIPGEL